MRYLLTILIFTICALFQASGQVLKYISTTPDTNSEVEQFAFTLKFDLSECIAQNGEAEYGIGVGGYYYEGDDDINMFVGLYEGLGDSKRLISTALTENINGQSSYFKVGDELDVSFPEVIPVDGKDYTIIITNQFNIYKKGEKRAVNKSLISFLDDPIVLTYKGKSSTSVYPTINYTSIESNSYLSNLKTLTLGFNVPININSNMIVSVLDMMSGESIGLSNSVKSTANDNEIIVDFDEISLYVGRNYQLIIPSGLVSLKEDSSITNDEFRITINGNNYHYAVIKESCPNGESQSLPSQLSVTFDLPESMQVKYMQGCDFNLKANIYKGDVENGSIVSTIDGKASSDGKGILWDIDFSMEPETMYTLNMPKGQFYFNDGSWRRDWVNDEILVSFTTPDKSVVGLPQLEFNAPLLDKSGASTLKDNGEYASLTSIYLPLKDNRYEYNGEKYKLKKNTGYVGYLYEESPSGDVLVKEIPLTTVEAETTTYYYNIGKADLDVILYKGKTYKIVIPEGSYGVNYAPIQYYVVNPELSYRVVGTTPTEVIATECTLEDGIDVSVVPVLVSWTFDGVFVLNDENIKAKREKTTTVIGKPVTNTSYPTTLISYGTNKTYLTIVNHDFDGKEIKASAGATYRFVLPKGLLCVESDPTITNDEISVSVNGVKAQDYVKTEFVNLTVETEGLHSTSHKAVKGETSEVRLIPDSYWSVEELTLNGTDVISSLDNGVYTTPVLNDDTEVKAKLAYNGSLIFADTTTGVALLPENNVKIYSDGEQIVIEGVTVGDEIVIYSVNGMVIGRHVATDNTVKVTIGSGQYIVRVGNTAANILH